VATTTQSDRGVDRARYNQLKQLLSRQGTAFRSGMWALREGRPSGVMNLEERASDAEGEGVAFSLMEMTARTVQGIETALRRLDAGELASCDDCGCAIAEARLRAVPFASRCVACQEEQDSGRPPARP
jgi:DnaK suppressor protein